MVFIEFYTTYKLSNTHFILCETYFIYGNSYGEWFLLLPVKQSTVYICIYYVYYVYFRRVLTHTSNKAFGGWLY